MMPGYCRHRSLTAAAADFTVMSHRDSLSDDSDIREKSQLRPVSLGKPEYYYWPGNLVPSPRAKLET
jgi:hypothetical protein